jgi:hypothetical protein
MLLKTRDIISYNFNEYTVLLWYNTVSLFALHQQVDVPPWSWAALRVNTPPAWRAIFALAWISVERWSW